MPQGTAAMVGPDEVEARTAVSTPPILGTKEEPTVVGELTIGQKHGVFPCSVPFIPRKYVQWRRLRETQMCAKVFLGST